MRKITTFKLAGMAGQGIKSSGISFAKFCARSGYEVYTYIEYPSLIRGGHNVMQINTSLEPVLAPSNSTDVLIALNQEGVDFHLEELSEDSFIVLDSDAGIDTSKVDDKTTVIALPLLKMAREAGKDILLNTVALGAVIGLSGGNDELFKKLVEDEYSDKGKEVVEMNYKAIDLGSDYVRDKFKDKINDCLDEKTSLAHQKKKMVINGNEAAALGAIAGGLQFSAIYPMSPISNILHVLAKHQEEYGYIYKQPEDEISAIGMVIGAAHAGARSLTATSGGGFALMGEMYGLAGLSEVPIVIIEGMRGAPATGLPTWSEQGDLRFVLHAHQGDFPRIVLTPGDPKEVFEYTRMALNLAEKYQTPVVVLIDKNICDNDQTFEVFEQGDYEVDRGIFTLEDVEDYKRFEVTANGISLRSTPGTNNFFIGTSDEHNEYGYSEESIENRNAQMEKRMQKLVTCEEEDMMDPILYGPEEADLTIVGWGSNKGVVLQALREFENVNFLHVTWMNPFPSDAVKKVLEKSKYIINMECNYSAQFGGLLTEKTNIVADENYLKYDGRPFYVEEVVEKIKQLLQEKGASK